MHVYTEHTREVVLANRPVRHRVEYCLRQCVVLGRAIELCRPLQRSCYLVGVEHLLLQCGVGPFSAERVDNTTNEPPWRGILLLLEFIEDHACQTVPLG